MSVVHNVFHGLMLSKYIADPSPILQYIKVEYAPELREEVWPVKILDTRDKQLRKKMVRPLKVQ